MTLRPAETLENRTGMRVLFWSELFSPYRGGIELLAARFVSAMQARGYEYLVVTSHDHLELPDQESYDGVRVQRFPFRAALRTSDAGAFIDTRLELARLRRAFAPELIHLFHIGPSALFHLSQTEGRSIPTLATLHGEVLRGTVGGGDSVLEKAVRAADWTTGVSDAVLRAARGMAPEIAHRSSVLHTGLEEPRLAPSPPPREPRRLLCLGRLVHDKGFDLALNAFASLMDRFRETRLIVAGDGPLRRQLEQRADELQLGDRVELVGWIASDEVPSLINSANLVLMPSRREGLPLVAIQSAHMARPVIAANVGGLPEVVAHGETGLIVAPEDSGALAEALSLLLEQPALAERMGRAARLRARELFSWERYLDASDALYRRLVTRTDVTCSS